MKKELNTIICRSKGGSMVCFNLDDAHSYVVDIIHYGDNVVEMADTHILSKQDLVIKYIEILKMEYDVIEIIYC